MLLLVIWAWVLAARFNRLSLASESLQCWNWSWRSDFMFARRWRLTPKSWSSWLQADQCNQLADESCQTNLRNLDHDITIGYMIQFAFYWAWFFLKPTWAKMGPIRNSSLWKVCLCPSDVPLDLVSLLTWVSARLELDWCSLEPLIGFVGSILLVVAQKVWVLLLSQWREWERKTHIYHHLREREREGGSEIFLPQSKLVNSEIDWSHREIFSHQSALMFAPDSAAPSFMIYQPSIWLRIMVPSHECSRKDT